MAAPMKIRGWSVCKLCGRISGAIVPLQILPCLRLYSQESAVLWRSVVGVEIHAQIWADSKLFSGSGSQFGAPINSQVSLFDAAFPGTLPVLNRRCVEAGILTSMALNSSVNRVSKFDRKHYFYADLPAGYQITQQRQPLATGGSVKFTVFNPSVHKKPMEKLVRLIQIQLEQDSGKSLHDMEERQSLIDLNRAGVGLMEIVTEPDLSDGEDAAGFVRELQLILQTIGTCDGKMEEGSLRVDANISVHQDGQPYGVRTEVKNINSLRGVAKAVDFEVERQIKLLTNGGQIVNETRSFDPETGETVAMRDKEIEQDYRFMPEPNLPPLHVYDNSTISQVVNCSDVVNIDLLRERLPELPAQKRQRLLQHYGLSLHSTLDLVYEDGLMDYFEKIMVETGRTPQRVANLLINEFRSNLNARDLTVRNSGVHPDELGKLCDMIESGYISFTTAKNVLSCMFDNPGQSPIDIVKKNHWQQISDQLELEKVCQKVLAENEKAVQEYKNGKRKIFNGLVGQVQKILHGKGDPKIVSQILKEMLSR